MAEVSIRAVPDRAVHRRFQVKRSVLLAVEACPPERGLGDRLPSTLLPLVDRPFLQHVVEHLVDCGIAEIRVVLSHMPEKVEALFEEGQRWGIRIGYILAPSEDRAWAAVRSLSLSEPAVLLGRGDVLPRLDPEGLVHSGSPHGYFTETGEGGREWTGWAVVSGKDLAAMPDAYERLTPHVMEHFEGPVVGACLSARTDRALLEAQEAAMKGAFGPMMTRGTQVAPGIWISRNVSLPGSVTLREPVFIGENCRIGEGVVLGPNAVLSDDCVVDRRSRVRNAVVMSDSYIGEDLEVADALVDRNRLVNVRLGAVLPIRDDFLLGNISRRHLTNWLRDAASRLAGMALMIPAIPLIVAARAVWAARGKGARKLEVLRLPSGEDLADWRTFALAQCGGKEPCQEPRAHFFGTFLPGLFSVVRGDLRLVGLAPRSPAEVRDLPPEWLGIYLQCKAGLITEAHVQGVDPGSKEEVFAAEAYYAARAGLRYDLGLLFKYAVRLFR